MKVRIWSFIMGIGCLLNSACAVFGVRGEETPEYRVIFKEGDGEIRQYERYVIAKTTVSGKNFKQAQNEGFSRLAKYIFGGNKQKSEVAMTAPVSSEVSPDTAEEIAMTAPVTAEPDGQDWTVTFMMPSKYTLDTLPEPDDDRVKFEEVPARRVAALTFTGSRDEEDNQKKGAELRSWVEGLEKYDVSSELTTAGYDPPWTIPFLRRNEVMFNVSEK